MKGEIWKDENMTAKDGEESKNKKKEKMNRKEKKIQER